MLARHGTFALLATVIACTAHHRDRPVSPVQSDGIIGRYDVAFDGKANLQIEAWFDRVDERLAVEAGAETFVEDVEVRSGDRWWPVARSGRFFSVPACHEGRCQLRYRFRLRDAARAIDEIESATEEGDALEAPPSTWLLAPVEASANARLRFHVTTPPDTTFRTGVFRSESAPNTWDIAFGDLWTSSYSVFGPLRVRALDERVELAIAPGTLAVSDEAIATWATNSIHAITDYFGRFPMPSALVIVVPSRGRWMGMGKTLSGGGGAIFVRVGERATAQALAKDWVLVHEMIHLALPSVPRGQEWAEEGLATYVEPFVRSRAGLTRPEDAWSGLVSGLPHGLPKEGDRGLDGTPTWGRTYWGGALFYLLADLEIRKRTKNAKGLADALRGVLARGNNTQRWSLEEVFRTGDASIGVPVLSELHRAMGASPHPVDLAELWAQLGVVSSKGSVTLDDRAPLAAVRRAIERRALGE